MPKLSVNEREALMAWKECETGVGFGFKIVAKRTKLKPHLIRRTVRALARKGLVQFAQCLFDQDDGEVMGAGYTLTEAGRAALKAES